MQTPSFTEGISSLDLRQRLLRVFYAPRESFAAARAAPTWHDWFVPVAVVCLLGMASHYLTAPVVLDPQSPAIQQQLQSMPEEQRQKTLESMAMYRSQGWMLVFVGTFTSLLAVGLVLFGVARLVFQSQATFQQMLIVKGYASLVIGVEWVVRTPLILLRGDPPVQLGPGALVPEEWARTLAGQVLAGIQLFDLWQAWLIGLGLAAMTGAPLRRAMYAVLLLWGLWVVGVAGVEMVRPPTPVPSTSVAPPAAQ